MRTFSGLISLLAILSASLALTACGSDDMPAASELATEDATVADDLGGLDSADATADTATPEDALADTAQPDAAIDAPDAQYKDAPFETASHTPLPQLLYGGIAVLHHPHIVTVTFAGDGNADTFEKFAAQLGDTQWWMAWSVSYCSSVGNCVGKPTTDKVRLGVTAAKSYTDSTVAGGAATIQQFIKTHIDNADLPAPVTDTVYLIYFPQGTQISLASGGGQVAKSCQQFGGYHHSMKYGAGQIAYAIVPECKNGGNGMSALDNIILAASHEIAEAVTDPYFEQTQFGEMPGGFNLNMQDYNSIPWVLALGGGENADLCPDLPYAGFGHAEENGYKLSRVWSNAAAKASHNPCVPADPGPYFNAAPDKKGTHIKIEKGASATIALHAFSDMPTQPWTVTAIDIDPFQGGGTALQFDFDGKDSVTVNNGDVVNLTITRDAFAQAASPYGAIFYVMSTSADGQATNMWPIWTYTNAEFTGK